MSPKMAYKVRKERELMKDVFKRLSTQQLDSFFDSFYNYLTQKSGTPNLITDHPECQWFMSAVKTAYNVFFKRQYVNYTEETLTPDVEAMLTRETLDHITQFLVEQFDVITAGLEFDFVVALAGEKYESQSSENLSIVILPEISCEENKKTASFLFAPHNQLPLCYQNVHAIRKQMNLAHRIDVDGASERRVLAIAKNYDTDTYQTVGIFPEQVVLQYPSISFKKSFCWELHVPKLAQGEKKKETCCLLRYYRGALKLPLIDLKPEILKWLSTRFASCKDGKNISERIAEIIMQVDSGFGAILIFGNTKVIKREAHTLAEKLGRGMLLPEPMFLTKTEELTKRLTGIDGALMIDFQGRCHAYGVILDGKAKTKGNIGRGSRFNSTLTYIKHRKKSSRKTVLLGIVKSEDGMLDFID